MRFVWFLFAILIFFAILFYHQKGIKLKACKIEGIFIFKYLIRKKITSFLTNIMKIQSKK